MSIADARAALAAMAHGLYRAMDREDAELLRTYRESGVKSWTTPWGQVTIVESEGEWVLRVDEDVLLGMAEAAGEVEVVTPEPVKKINPAYRAKLLNALVAAGGKAIDKNTGEIVDYASAVWRAPAKDPYVAYPSTKQQKKAKEAAEWWAISAVASLTGEFLAQTAIEGES